MKAHEIRRSFIDFFVKKCDHHEVPSSPVIPHNDPTLLFTNAGMNQFKDVFLGRGTRPWNKIANSQKCIRAGGKHNDLEDVGNDTWHHTFFEMLGNWSFGDYFKEEAIFWSWELLTDVWGLDPNRLHITVFNGNPQEKLNADNESLEIWQSISSVNKDHITLHDRKDNFWEMGLTGPCGPCSEIHYDSTLNANGAKFVNKDHPLVIELWNLVFIQFNRNENGLLETLPSKHIDTGMGLERAVRTLQNKNSNYETDLFTPIFESISQITKTRKYKGKLDDPIDTAYRVIADHLRCLSVAICDGALPGNEGRNYVLRRILRRASRMSFQILNKKEPIMFKLIPTICETLSNAFPELNHEQEKIQKIIYNEEETFLKNLDRGLLLFDQVAKDALEKNKPIQGKEVFSLHDTYGFPFDLTKLMAKEKNLKIDVDEYQKFMKKAREVSRKNTQGNNSSKFNANDLNTLKNNGIKKTIDSFKEIDDVKKNQILKAIWHDNQWRNNLQEKDKGILIFDFTNFYSESGGQIGDTGEIYDGDNTIFKVIDTQKVGNYVTHEGFVQQGAVSIKKKYTLMPNKKRRDKIRKHHTATHLLNHALKRTLGNHIQQKGSLVDNDKLRFDFSHNEPLNLKQLQEIEKIVLEVIKRNLNVNEKIIPLNAATSINGIRAIFGERYPDNVRVISIGPDIDQLIGNPKNKDWINFSTELCGGSHVKETLSIESFTIISESGLASGVRRIIALVGEESIQSIKTGHKVLNSLNNIDVEKDCKDLISNIQKILGEEKVSLILKREILEKLSRTKKEIKNTIKKKEQSESSKSNKEVKNILNSLSDNSKFVVSNIGKANAASLLFAVNTIKKNYPKLPIMIASEDPDNDKIHFICEVPKELTHGGLSANNWIKKTCIACDGSGGGRNESARGAGKQTGHVSHALKIAQDYLKEYIK